MSLDTFQQLHNMLWGKKNLESDIIYEKTIDRLPSHNPNYPDSSTMTYSVVDLSICHTVHPIFPQDHSTILERSEYREILLKLDDLDRKRRRYTGGVAVTGQPGIGKTFFLYYILIKRLLEGKCTVLQDRAPYFLFFDDAGCREIQITDTQHADLSDKPYAMRQTWILVDSNDGMDKPAEFATGRLCDAFVVQASSPRISRWKGWVKERGGRALIMQPWSWPEIYAAGTQIRDNPLSLDCLRRAFYYFGPVVRLCLMASEDDDEFMDALHSMEQAILEVENFPRTIQDVQNQRASSHATHRIFLISANNTNQRVPVWSFVSDHALDLMLTNEFQSDQRNINLMYKTMAAHSDTRTAAGIIFEKRAHLVLASGGVYTPTPLEEPGDPLQFRLLPTVGGLERYNDIEDLKTILNRDDSQAILDHYLVPQPRNFPVNDSLSISSAGQVILFQITMANRHPMLVAQLEKLLTCFPRAYRPSAFKPWNIVFVVPPEKVETFRRQQLNSKDAPFHLRQYKLGLDTKTKFT
ncbi:hypothetical protein K439DRAFT_1623009 [Ramaria rubella]|nr:hypothetical protein K439DRAFT_1623009 [Ramaria rubella]